MIYTFICDPDECDAMIIFHARDGFGYPNGEVKMTCPCGRKMQYISMMERVGA
jgi:hypothetical protein